MNTRRITLAQGIIAERAGDNLLLFTPYSKETRRVDGLGEDVIEALVSGESISAQSSPVLLSLIEEGTLLEDHGVSRRSVVKAAAIGSAASITVLSMPQAASASSDSAGGTLYALIIDSGFRWGDYVELVDLGAHTLEPDSTDLVFFVQVFAPPDPPYTSPSPLTGTISWTSETFTTYLVEFGGGPVVDVSPAIRRHTSGRRRLGNVLHLQRGNLDSSARPPVSGGKVSRTDEG